MTFEEAKKIFNEWAEYAEINDKLNKIFHPIPESFLPYPIEVLEEALNIIAKKYFDEGDIKMSDNIKESIASLMFYKDDDEAIAELVEGIVLKDPELRKIKISSLKKARDSWLKAKKEHYS